MGELFKGFVTMLMFFLTVLGVLFGWSLVMAFPVKWLWNYSMPTIFNLCEIGYQHALSMLLLTGLLFRANISKNAKKSEN